MTDKRNYEQEKVSAIEGGYWVKEIQGQGHWVAGRGHGSAIHCLYNGSLLARFDSENEAWTALLNVLLKPGM